MKLNFWTMFIYFTVALAVEILVPVRRYVLIGTIDIVFLAAILTRKTEIKLGELIILNVFFIANNFRSTGFFDVLCDVIFVLLSLFYVKTQIRSQSTVEKNN